MSNKNHKMVNGRLIKMDKSFADLKISQKEKILEWLFEEYYSLFKSNGYKYSKDFDDEILSNVYTKIELAEIWLPYGELSRYYYSKKKRFENRVIKSVDVCDIIPIE